MTAFQIVSSVIIFIAIVAICEMRVVNKRNKRKTEHDRREKNAGTEPPAG